MSLNELIDLCAYMDPDDLDIVRRAHAFASTHHQNQTRHSGEPYIIHLEQVAIILAKLRQQRTTIVASLLHDVLEDTDITTNAIESEFGATILNLVEGATKLERIHFPSNIDQQAENYRKLFMAMTKDIRIIIIKLADRLHNMRTLHHLRPDKQRRIAQETLEIFSPLAHRLGMGSIKWELEDLAFATLYREEFNHLKSLLAINITDRDSIVSDMCQQIRDILATHQIPGDVTGRAKHFYSIYKKLQADNIELSQLFDLYGIRIITESIPKCYEVLGYVHANYPPVSGRLKDYIALPKSNLYQSLHTTVIGPKGNRIEIQIRTQDMHIIAENGIAAHWMYKEKVPQNQQGVDFSWLNQILNEQSHSPNAFIENVKINLYEDDVFVFTPKGDILVLPQGATILDAAFKIHTDIGLRFKSGMVNGRMVPIHYKLNNGDQILIQHRRIAQPNLGWLDIATTRLAKSHVKAFFKRQDAELRRQLGETALKRLLLKYGFIKSKKDPIGSFLDRIIKQSQYQTHHDVLSAIGRKSLSDTFIIKICRNDAPIDPFITPKVTKKLNKPLVVVDGESDIDIHIAKCCQPLPGDSIVGYITRGFGVAIHQRDCRVLLKNKQPHRITSASWIQESQQLYATDIQLIVIDRTNLLKDILETISRFHINISRASTRLYKNGQAKIFLTCEIGKTDDFTRISQELMRFEDVLDVQRITKSSPLP